MIGILNRHVNLAMLLAAITIVLPLYVFGEKIDRNNGFGMDGWYYGTMAKAVARENVADDLENKMGGVSYQFIQRIFPSVVVGLPLRFFRFFSIEPTDQHIVTGFVFLNLLLVALIAHLWGLIADELRVSHRGKWLGFTAMLLNFAVLKMSSFYPVLTDIPAYAIGMLMLYLYLTRNTMGLLLTTLAGAFTWPLAIYVGFLLVSFPRRLGDKPSAPWAPYHLHVFVASGLAISLLLYLKLVGSGRGPASLVDNVAIGVSLAYVFFGVASIVNCGSLFSFTTFRNSVFRPDTAATLALLFGVKYFQQFFPIHRHHGNSTIAAAFQVIASTSISYPGIFFVAHVMYFGPVLVLALFLWKPVCRTIHHYGAGLTCSIALALLLGLFSESRGSILSFALLVPFVVKVTDFMNWRPVHYWFFAITSVLVSKVWLTIGTVNGAVAGHRNESYYMNFGPWMSGRMYAVQGTVVVLVGCLIYWFYLRGKTPQAATAAG